MAGLTMGMLTWPSSVDEEYHGVGVGTFLLHYLIELAKSRGTRGFSTDVLTSNKAMMRVFEKSPYETTARVSAATHETRIPFAPPRNPNHPGVRFVRGEPEP